MNRPSAHSLWLTTTVLATVVTLLCLSGCFQDGGVSGGGILAGGSKKAVPSPRDAGEAFRLVNQERARRGMQTLQRKVELDRVAALHARDLLAMNQLSHISSDGGKLENRLAQLDWEWAGENLARNKGFESPAAEAVKGWIASPKHFENMFRSDFSHTGMAALYDPDTGFTYFVQVFIIPTT